MINCIEARKTARDYKTINIEKASSITGIK